MILVNLSADFRKGERDKSVKPIGRASFVLEISKKQERHMTDSILYERLIDNLRKNSAALHHILKTVSQEEAALWRDGPDGWTVLDIMCHLRDYEDIFRERGELMMADIIPTYPVYDHIAMVVEREYHAQILLEVLADFAASREKTAVFFTNLTESDWQRIGNHVEHGTYTMVSLAAHIVWHDSNHIEQITRVIAGNS